MRLTKEIVARGATNGCHTYEQLRAIGVRFEGKQPTRWKWMIDVADITEDQYKLFLDLKRPDFKRKTKRHIKKKIAPAGPYAGLEKNYYFKSPLWKSIKSAVLTQQPFCAHCNYRSSDVIAQTSDREVWRGKDLSLFQALCKMHYNEKASGWKR